MSFLLCDPLLNGAIAVRVSQSSHSNNSVRDHRRLIPKGLEPKSLSREYCSWKKLLEASKGSLYTCGILLLSFDLDEWFEFCLGVARYGPSMAETIQNAGYTIGMRYFLNQWMGVPFCVFSSFSSNKKIEKWGVMVWGEEKRDGEWSRQQKDFRLNRTSKWKWPKVSIAEEKKRQKRRTRFLRRTNWTRLSMVLPLRGYQAERRTECDYEGNAGYFESRTTVYFALVLRPIPKAP